MEAQRFHIEMAIEAAVRAVKRLDFSDEQVYSIWLQQAYTFVRHSTPLLALSCGRAIDNRSYHLRCISHLAEEKGHDKMILNDLKALGVSENEIVSLPSAQAFFQSQYYWIEHVNPVSFIGYITVLEGLAVKGGAEKTAQVGNRKATSFLALHVEEDTDHLERAFTQIGMMSEADQMQILQNARQTAGLYALMVDEIRTYCAEYRVRQSPRSFEASV